MIESETRTTQDTATPPSGDETSQVRQDSEADQRRREEMYERFVAKSRALYEAGQEKTREALNKAMSKAEEFTAEQGEVFKTYMRRDLDQTGTDMRVLGKEAWEHLHPARVGAGALSSLAHALHATEGALDYLYRKTESALHYNAGEIAAAGTLTCVQCGHKVQLKRTSIVPHCSNCQGGEFRKGY